MIYPGYELWDPMPELRFICAMCHEMTPDVGVAEQVVVGGIRWYRVVAVCINCDHVWDEWLFKHPDAG